MAGDVRFERIQSEGQSLVRSPVRQSPIVPGGWVLRASLELRPKGGRANRECSSLLIGSFSTFLSVVFKNFLNKILVQRIICRGVEPDVSVSKLHANDLIHVIQLAEFRFLWSVRRHRFINFVDRAVHLKPVLCVHRTVYEGSVVSAVSAEFPEFLFSLRTHNLPAFLCRYDIFYLNSRLLVRLMQNRTCAIYQIRNLRGT